MVTDKKCKHRLGDRALKMVNEPGKPTQFTAYCICCYTYSEEKELVTDAYTSLSHEICKKNRLL